MRRIAGILGIAALFIFAGGCCLYFGDDDDTNHPPGVDGGPAAIDAHMADAGPVCEFPEYSADCAEVPSFQCGFFAECDGNAVVATWHEHVYCEGYGEQIIDYTCSTECADSCANGRIGWPESGADLVALACVAGGTGSSCDGQCGLALDDCYCDEACVGHGDCCDDYVEFCVDCEDLDEEACKTSADCMPVYTGHNCTDPDGNACTSGDSNCTCESFTFAECTDAI